MSRITCSELLERGDLALLQDDKMTLARVARLLASRIGDPLSDRCHHLAQACDREGPATEWKRLRAAIVDRMAIAGS
ncbi:MAG: hypothetical protein ABI678_01555 [Kofleriaceae bacterium]